MARKEKEKEYEVEAVLKKEVRGGRVRAETTKAKFAIDLHYFCATYVMA